MLWTRSDLTLLGLHGRDHRFAGPQRVIISTDLLLSAFRLMFPAERMLVCGGRTRGSSIRLTSVVDVTEPGSASTVHVRACPARLGQALLDFERTGSHFAAWMHSHPGTGVESTRPSHIDTKQEAQLLKDYSPNLLNIIAVQDGWIRLWGHASQRLVVRWSGKGVLTQKDTHHVVRLNLR
jgi:proteasome lid subunit RPN8/RPN11